jgi:hypothetical protein
MLPSSGRKRATPSCAPNQHYARDEPRRGGELDTIFFGGGTLVVPPQSIANFLHGAALVVMQRWRRNHVEANPGTVDADKLRAFRVRRQPVSGSRPFIHITCTGSAASTTPMKLWPWSTWRAKQVSTTSASI